jgi:hypothetical protein
VSDPGDRRVLVLVLVLVLVITECFPSFRVSLAVSKKKKSKKK